MDITASPGAHSSTALGGDALHPGPAGPAGAAPGWHTQAESSHGHVEEVGGALATPHAPQRALRAARAPRGWQGRSLRGGRLLHEEDGPQAGTEDARRKEIMHSSRARPTFATPGAGFSNNLH